MLKMGTRREERRWIASGAAIFVALIVDLVSKHAAEVALARGRQIPMFAGDLTLRLLFNKGASLGVGSNVPLLVSILVVFGTAALIIWSFRSPLKWLRLSLGLAAGGSLGNLADRTFRPPGLFRGAVIDWISLFHENIVFNLADVFIRIGIVVAILILIFDRSLWSRDRTRL